MQLSDEIRHFLKHAGFAVVSTIDKNGAIHTSCKGLVDIDEKGSVYLLDLYRQRTHHNLIKNPSVSLTFVDEHRFKGFCLKGEAQILDKKKISKGLVRAWEERITSRITTRILRNMYGQKGHPSHPEASMPQPKYIIRVDVHRIVDLTPHTLRK